MCFRERGHHGKHYWRSQWVAQMDSEDSTRFGHLFLGVEQSLAYQFPVEQEGKIGFKYRVQPYIGAYDVVRSHRFAMEQYRPLVAVQTRKEFKSANPFSLKDSDKVVLSNYQVQDKGKSHIIRLLSLSEQDEQVSLCWGKKQPKAVYQNENGQKVKLPGKGNQVAVPAKGIRPLQVVW